MVMVFLSGVAGLLYQVLWMRQLGLLFGNTAHAAATTLSAFFGGLAAGSWFWGRRASATANPLRLYGRIEVGIAVSALLYFGILTVFRAIYPPVYRTVGPGAVLIGVKLLLGAALVFPPAFFMGGTIPAMGQFLIRSRDRFGETAAGMYGVNTLGAALGAFLAAFVCVPALGFRLTCGLTIAVTSGIALWAIALSRRSESGAEPRAFLPGEAAVDGPGPSGEAAPDHEAPDHEAPATPTRKKAKRKLGRRARARATAPTESPLATGLPRWAILGLAFFSGFSVLALEVLWTRMLSQIHENSVYSFATVLVTVLLSLALGAALASVLAGRRTVPPRLALAVLLLLGGVVLGLSPVVFNGVTNGMAMQATNMPFAAYFTALFETAGLTIAPPCVLLGTVFPFLMKSEERFTCRPGQSIGILSAVNTAGAVLGALACGFLLLRLLGMWRAVQAIASLYIVAAMLLPAPGRGGCRWVRAAGALCLVLLLVLVRPSALPVVGGDPVRQRETLVEYWETGECTVAVMRGVSGHHAIRINSNYTLGSTAAIQEQLFQARVPLFAFPRTRTVFFLGMGTGITVGGALETRLFESVERVVACEMVPEVVTAARRYFGGGGGGRDYTNGLFSDPRAEIVVDDGRHYLMATEATFDMINADLFLPYRSGAGSLYSREHFRIAKARLAPGGVFVQWLPLFQLTEYEFGVIARTMLGVFDRVTMWRNNFVPGRDIAALVGHLDDAPIPGSTGQIDEYKASLIAGRDWRHVEELPLFVSDKTVPLFYCGNLSAARALFADYPTNTDDRPLIEYASPRSIRQKRDDGWPPTLVGPRLAALVDTLLTTCPPSQDPVLADRSDANRRLPLAGAALYRVWLGHATGDIIACTESWNAFVREWSDGPQATAPDGEPDAIDGLQE